MDELKREAGVTPPYGTVAVFDTPGEILHAAEELRDSGYKHIDALTPFPVHGMERAIGLKPSVMPWVSLAGAAFGLSGMFLLAYFVSYDYPLNISGKPVFSWQAYVPLFFELMVLFCAFATFFGVWGLCRLPTFWHPVVTHPRFPQVTDDKFMMVVEARDPIYDAVKIKETLERLGGHDVMEVRS
jgi:hypothetical protein